MFDWSRFDNSLLFLAERMLTDEEEVVGKVLGSGPLSYGQSFYPFCYGTKPTEQDFQIMWSVPALMYGNYDGIEHLKITKCPHSLFSMKS